LPIVARQRQIFRGQPSGNAIPTLPPGRAAAAQPAIRNGDRDEIFSREKIFSMLKTFYGLVRDA
jgi:hypothetical protein